MSRILSAAILLALLGATGDAFAQAGCQPTISQPCAKTADRPGNPTSPARRTNAQSDEPKDNSPRIKIDKDTDFKFGTGGLGLQRKF